MDNKDLPEFSKVMAVLSTTYEKTTSEELLSIYYDVLKQFPLDDIKSAVGNHIQTSKFFPRPAEIIALIKPLETIEIIADKAWNQLLKAISKHGYYDSVQFEDKVIHSCIRSMGGWMQVSDREPDTWMHKDFVNFYKSYYGSYSQEEHACGLIEKQNGIFNVAKIRDDSITIKEFLPSGLKKGNVLTGKDRRLKT